MIKKNLQKIFKNISYFIFSKIHGRIEESVSIESDKRINAKIVNFEKNLKYKVYIINGGRLYTDRIHDTAAIIENKIIEGPSFQLRENNNSSIKNNSVFEKGTPRRLFNLKGTVLSLLTGGGGNNNYWHWLYDVLPRIELCAQAKNLESIDYFLFPNLKNKFQIESLHVLNLPKEKLLSSEKFRHIKAEQLITTDHPYVFTNDSHHDAQNVPKWIVEWLRKKFLMNLNNQVKNYPRKIYLDRSDSRSNVAGLRSILNENSVRELLIKKNFTIVRLYDLDFLEQVRYFNNAEYIVGLHGAALANLAFCKKNTKVIEFSMHKTGKMYENIAKINNLNYSSIKSDPNEFKHTKQLGHIKVSIEELEKKLNYLTSNSNY